MKIKKLIVLPWRLREVVRSIRRELADVRWAIDDVRRAVATLESHQQGLVRELGDRCGRDQEDRQRGEQARERDAAARHAIYLEAHARLLAEVREQGLVLETAVRAPARAAAEGRLRERLGVPHRREPGVSVLVPCWNHVGYLGRAVASAIAVLETLPVPGEVILLDDASRDGSRELGRELARADLRVRQVASDENLGLPRARNVLLAQARFEHAVILDSDNELVPSGVACLYESARRTGAVLTYGNIVNLDQDGAVVDVMSSEPLTPEILRRNWIDAMSLVRVERLLELGGYEHHWLNGLEDWELNQRLFSLGEPVVFVPVLVGKYATLPASMLREAPLERRCRRGFRIFGSVDATDPTAFRSAMHHPAVGTIWASSGWPAPVALPRPAARRTGPQRRVLVVSSGGVLNYGDDAILLSTLQRLQRICPDALVNVVSDGPHCPPLGRMAHWLGTCEEFACGLDPYDVARGCGEGPGAVGELSRWLKLGTACPSEVAPYDAVLMAGGGNLNHYWPMLIARRATIAAAARVAGVPYLLSGQGVGPISEEIVPLLSILVPGASAVATRDPGSLELLRRDAWAGPTVDMVGDDALGLHCEGMDAVRLRLAQIGVPSGRPLLAFHARSADYVGFERDELEQTAQGLDAFADSHGFDIVAVPINMQTHGTELELLAGLATDPGRRATWHVVDPGGDIATIAGVVKACQAVVSHSYHIAIFALEDRIPTLLFARTEYYRLKAEALRAGFGVPVSILAEPDIEGDEIAGRFRAMTHESWGRGMTSDDVDDWLRDALSRCCPRLVAPREDAGGSTFARAG